MRSHNTPSVKIILATNGDTTAVAIIIGPGLRKAKREEPVVIEATEEPGLARRAG